MKCLNCRKCEITITTEICPECSVYLPHLMKDILKPTTILHNNTYKIEYPLGRGGFGITYQAIHINLEERVAIKEFYPYDIARNSATNILIVAKQQEEIFQKNLEKFKKEGKTLARLRDNNIVRVRDLFEANSTAYLVMELLEGHSLRDELNAQNKGYFTVEQAKNIVDNIVNALDTIHKAGIYHLDIKPDNIMVTNQGKIVLIDFGSAKEVATGISRGYITTNIPHTPEYAPTEVISRRDSVGPESDIFELGMMLHELLTGKRPPKAEDRLRQQFLDGEPPWKAEAVPSLWKELIEQAVELKKEKRPNSVKEWWRQINSRIEVNSSPKLPTNKFTFETVKVDIKGNIVERIKGQSNQYIEDLGNSIKLEMVEIPAGTFMMGTSEQDKAKEIAEVARYWKEEDARRWTEYQTPQHQVKIPKFYLGKYPVTQKQYQAIMGNNPSNFKGDDLPVEKVTWHNAVEFCKKLSAKTGKNYRLPSEAEWEYACRAGTTSPFALGQTITPDIVNYDGNYPYGQAIKGQYRQKTTPVGSLGVANAFGLYDMHGNVWEWCQDVWHDNYNGAPTNGSVWESSGGNNTYRVLRGGSWFSLADNCRSAFRFWYAPVSSSYYLGFRHCLSCEDS